MTRRRDPATAMTGRGDLRPPGDIGLDRVFGGDDLNTMRAAVTAHAGQLGITGEDLEHLLIVASELVNNAVRHGGGAGRLRLWPADNCLYCQVSDHGPGIAEGRIAAAPPDPGQVGGRGLWIARRLSERLDIVSSGGGVVVTAVMRAPGSGHRAHAPAPRPRQA